MSLSTFYSLTFIGSSNMRTEKEIEEYLATRWFKKRHYAYYIRGFLLTEFPDNKNFQIRIAFSNAEGINLGGEVITAADAIKFIEDEI